MNVTRADGPLNPEAHESALASLNYNLTDFIWFHIEIKTSDGDSSNKLGEIRLELDEFHKRKREAFPTKLSIRDKQTLRIIDSKYFLSPYPVMD